MVSSITYGELFFSVLPRARVVDVFAAMRHDATERTIVDAEDAHNGGNEIKQATTDALGGEPLVEKAVWPIRARAMSILLMIITLSQNFK